LSACTGLPQVRHKTLSTVLVASPESRLGRAWRDASARRPGDVSGFRLLLSGHEAFLARAELARAAEHGIDAQYYLFHNDETGWLMLRELLAAADRGVRVRLLVDDMDLAGHDQALAALDAHPHFELRVFNPFSRASWRSLQFVTRFGSATRRMHNKSFTADNLISVVGGRNIGNEYFESNPDVDFGDLDVAAFGPVVKDVSASFDRYWNHELAYPARDLHSGEIPPGTLDDLRAALNGFAAQGHDGIFDGALTETDLYRELRANDVTLYWGRAQVVADDPDKLAGDPDQFGIDPDIDAAQLLPRLLARAQRIREELIVVSPYFVPGDIGVEFLARLRALGVRVRILTNSLASTDVAAVHAGYAKYRVALLRAGVELYEGNRAQTVVGLAGHWQSLTGSSRASLHAKSFVIDRDRAFIGSLNLDPRSVQLNTELGLLIEAPDMAADMANWFDRHIDRIAYQLRLQPGPDGAETLHWVWRGDGAEQVLDTEPNTTWAQRAGIRLLSLLPFESQL
jgi:putative cardiolipin synthase